MAEATRPEAAKRSSSAASNPLREEKTTLASRTLDEIKPVAAPIIEEYVAPSTRSINSNVLSAAGFGGGATLTAGNFANADAFEAVSAKNGSSSALQSLERKLQQQQQYTPFMAPGQQQASDDLQRLEARFRQDTQQNQVEMQMANLSISSVQTSSASAATAVSLRPAVIPSPPYALTSTVIDLEVPLAQLREVVEEGLRDSNVDYEYNERKWKAKCFVFRTRGQCNFVVRLYTPRAAAPSSPADEKERFTMELQRRRGCCNMFRHSYDRLIAHFGTRKLLPLECAAANRLRSLYAVLASSPTKGRLPSSSKGAITSTGGPGVPSPGGDSASSPASMVPGSPAEAGAAAAEVRATSSGTAASFPPPPPPAGVVALLEAARDVQALMSSSAEYYFGSPVNSPHATSGRHAEVDGCCDNESTTDFHEDEEGEIVEDRSHTASIPQGSLAPPHMGGSAPVSPASREVSTASDDSALHPHGVTYNVSAEEAHSVVGALGSLLDMLKSDFEDVCTPASQSVSLLSGSARVRNALGSVLRDYLAIHRSKNFGLSSSPFLGNNGAAASSSSAAAAGVSPNTEADGLLAISLLGSLVNRATDSDAVKAASIECRTNCAFALANFSRDLYVADALMMFQTPKVLIEAAAVTPLCARNACLRRQLLRVMWHSISSSPRHARLAINNLHCIELVEAAANNPATKGLEPGFDALAAKILERLHHEKLHGEAGKHAAGASDSKSGAAAPAEID